MANLQPRLHPAPWRRRFARCVAIPSQRGCARHGPLRHWRTARDMRARSEPTMDALLGLMQRHPLIFFHLVTATGALLLGLFMLLRRKGTRSHRLLGWTWVALMASTALASAFIRDYRLPNLWGYTPIHLFTVTVAVMLPLGLWYAKRGRIEGHRKTMQRLYIGACVVAGLFTLLPGRFLGSLLWGTPLTGLVS